MYQTPEQIIAMNKTNIETAMRFAGVAFSGAERMLDLQMQAAKSAFTDGLEHAKALSSVKDLNELNSYKAQYAQPSLDKAMAYAKSVYEVANQTQAEISTMIEAQVAQFNSEVVANLDQIVKTAPPGSEAGVAAIKSGIAAVNVAYENFSKVAKQFTQAAQANAEAAVEKATASTKKSRK